MTPLLKLTLVCILILIVRPVHADIVNGSFEDPLVPSGSFTNFLGGSTDIPGWTVVGSEVSIVDSAAMQNGITFQSQDGQQWLDLAGFANPSMSNGVTQDVATTIGTQYALAFYVGSATDGQIFFPSVVDLSIDGGPRMSFTNPTAPNNMLDWQQFSHSFTAQNATTTITFFDGTGASNFLSGLDNVSFDESTLLGDVNLDGVVSLLDVSPFVSLLTSGGFQAEADLNQDGVVSLLDVAPFVDLLTGG